ncbi:hypothetical protein K490DRAFT_19236, partial [Saccharata proteae CBS 121410]
RKSKKGKKGQPEPKPQLDLAAALPSNDDFRTSLLMPNLSARFSMLRDADNPGSKMGKAADDSVLEPRRQSRLMNFGFSPNGLSDIAEVSSLHGSVRPPFAFEGRHGSIDGYGTDDDSSYGGSVMQRSRPGEGNVLFGGRQKIYQIPASGRGGGRTLYEDDVALSSFQRYRVAEKDKQHGQRQEQMDSQDDAPESPSHELKYSSSFSDSIRRRETSSSTGSGPRASTAATSIASQGANAIPPPSSAPPTSTPATNMPALERSATKGRRLYEQGLDRNIHEQQSSALNRLNSIQKQRTLGGRATPPLLQARSATNLSERYTRSHQMGRIASPPPSAPLANISSFSAAAKDTVSASSSPILGYPQSPPISPLVSEIDEYNPLTTAIHSNDRGKATAMGAFNKPNSQFDENQYLQRQKQMQQGRETPPIPRRRPSPSPSRRVQVVREEFERRSRNFDAEEECSRSTSSSNKHTEAPSAFSVFQKAANQMRASADDDESTTDGPDDSHQTFFSAAEDSDSDSDSESMNRAQEQPEDRLQQDSMAAHAVPDMAVHPAFRSQDNSRPQTAERPPTSRGREMPQQNSLTSSTQTDRKTFISTLMKYDATDLDSPTLGPDNGGLNGMIRQHLRQPSDVSSVYEDSAPPTAGLPHQQTAGYHASSGLQPDTPAHSSYGHSNPWDLDDLDYAEVESLSSVSLANSSLLKGQPFSHSGAAGEPVRTGTDTNPAGSFDFEVRNGHSRGASTTTQAEREAFANELAQRQKAIQESLKNKVENDSRSESPTSGNSGPFKAFGMLRGKSSRDSLARPDQSTKAMKMLGLNASSTSLARSSEEHWRTHEDRTCREPPKGMKPWNKASKTLQQTELDYRLEFEQRSQRGAGEDYSSGTRSPPKSRSSSTNRFRRRDRSNSNGRSPSRDRAISSQNASNSGPPPMPGQFPVFADPTPDSSGSMTSPEHRSSPQSRVRSGSRPGAPGYFDHKSLQVQTAVPPGPSPRLSPAANSPGAQSLPPLSRGYTSFSKTSSGPPSARSTPPSSSANVPSSMGFPSATPGPPPPSRTHASARKKSVAKSMISEPKLLSTTSVADVVELPMGASLSNGMDKVGAPPVPPINPMRRKFGFGRTESRESTSTSSSDP